MKGFSHRGGIGERFWQVEEASLRLGIPVEALLKRVRLYRGSRGSLRLIRPADMSRLLQQQGVPA